MERSTYYKIAIVLGAAALTTGAFSKETRKKIWKRDGGRCVMCGSTEHLNCSHIDHSKSNPKYDDESNGRLLCEAEHYLIDHVNREGRNGLPLHQNAFAKRSLWSRLSEEVRKKLPPP